MLNFGISKPGLRRTQAPGTSMGLDLFQLMDVMPMNPVQIISVINNYCKCQITQLLHIELLESFRNEKSWQYWH